MPRRTTTSLYGCTGTPRRFRGRGKGWACPPVASKSYRAVAAPAGFTYPGFIVSRRGFSFRGAATRAHPLAARIRAARDGWVRRATTPTRTDDGGRDLDEPGEMICRSTHEYGIEQRTVIR